MRIPDATERNVLLYCGSTAAVICLLPGDVVSASIAAALTGAFFLVHTRLLRQEEAVEAAAAKAAAETAAASENEPPGEPPGEPPTDDEREPEKGAEQEAS